MTDLDLDTAPPSRLAVIGRRLILGLAAVTLAVGLASTSFAPSAAPRSSGLAGKLNLNTASESELELLPGVGPTKAERILEFRTKHGPFKRVFDLRRVKGFGKKTVDRLTPFLTVSERTSLRSG